MTIDQKLLTDRRAQYTMRTPAWACAPEMRELEAQYGNVLLTYFDVEPIVPRDIERFRAWYNEHSKPIRKVRADIAGDPSTIKTDLKPLFRSINTHVDPTSTVWEQNQRSDLFVEFPELRDLVMQLPYTTVPPVSLWSSTRIVGAHRDEYLFTDLPAAFRAMVSDENTVGTLYLAEAPTDGLKQSARKYIVPPAGTNAFAWNNLRAMHGSDYHGRDKILLIVSPFAQFNLKLYRNLLERSISKYTPVIGKYERKNFISI